MKNLIIILIGIFSFASFTTSCSSDDDKNSTQIINREDLPDQAQNFLNVYFSSYPISSVNKDTNNGRVTYEVDFVNGVEIDFDNQGNWIEVDGNGFEFPVTFINPNIREYVFSYYPENFIDNIERKSNGFEVELNNDIEIFFNQDGEFVRIL